jgi:hypothetical protein
MDQSKGYQRYEAVAQEVSTHEDCKLIHTLLAYPSYASYSFMYNTVYYRQ